MRSLTGFPAVFTWLTAALHRPAAVTAALLAFIAAPLPAMAQLDIGFVFTALLFQHTDGVQHTLPYELEMTTCGLGLTGATVTPPDGDPVPLIRESDPGGCFDSGSDSPMFATKQVGVYVWELEGDGGDTASLDFNVAEPTGIAEITSPVHQAIGVSRQPSFTWDSVVGLGSQIEVVIVGQPPDF